jgi:putative DNA primase/helicase
MSFESFAAQHGLIIKHLVSDKWVRVPTTDHPHKRNGAYIYTGESGAVQNWAVHTKPISWNDGNFFVDYEDIRRRKEAYEKEVAERQAIAAKKAAGIMKQAKKTTHPYLAKKGFADDKSWVWNNLLVVPMRIGANLVGCQLIDGSGNKKFLAGQRTKGASAVFDNKGVEILCEGYATAMSIRRALKAVRTRYKLIVCFSAANILEISKNHPTAFLVADTDTTGINVANKSGLSYWKSDVDGEDFNDAETRMGSRPAGEELLNLIGRSLSKD